MASAGPYASLHLIPDNIHTYIHTFITRAWSSCSSNRRPTSHHSVFYRPDALPAAQPTASKHWMLQQLKSCDKILVIPHWRSRCVGWGDQWHLWLCVCLCTTWNLVDIYSKGQRVKGQSKMVLKMKTVMDAHLLLYGPSCGHVLLLLPTWDCMSIWLLRFLAGMHRTDFFGIPLEPDFVTYQMRLYTAIHFIQYCLQCFDAVGCAAGRASGLYKLEWWGAGVLSVCGKVQICIWPIWCHCHSLSLAPVNPDWFYFPGFTFLVLAYPGSPRQNPESHKTVVVVVCKPIIEKFDNCFYLPFLFLISNTRLSFLQCICSIWWVTAVNNRFLASRFSQVIMHWYCTTACRYGCQWAPLIVLRNSHMAF